MDVPKPEDDEIKQDGQLKEDTNSSNNSRQEFLQAVSNIIERWSKYDYLKDETEEAQLICHIVHSWKTKEKDMEDPLLFECMQEIYRDKRYRLRERVFAELPVTHKYLFADGSLERDIIDLIVNSELKKLHKNLIVIILADLSTFTTLKKYKETYAEDNITCWDVITQREKKREEIIDQVRNSISSCVDFKVSNQMCRCRA